MISLVQILLNEYEINRTEDGLFAAKNSNNFTRYFKDIEQAKKFARGEIKGPHPGRAVRKIKAVPKKEKKTDSIPGPSDAA